MTRARRGRWTSAVFIAFAGNCRQALFYYQQCFGGTLRIETVDLGVLGSGEKPVLTGTLVADTIVISGSDLVHTEGRTVGNHMAIFYDCGNRVQRRQLVEMLGCHPRYRQATDLDQPLIEVVDPFDVRWILAAY